MFTLPFNIEPSSVKIRLKDPIFSIGSCFSDNIGERLKHHKFDVLANPLGIIYNPYSIFKNLKLILTEGIDPENFIKNRGVYFHWDTHSTISGTELEDFKKLLNDRSLLAQKSLINAEWLIITLGTTYVYKYKETGKIVANCHKVPQSEFEKITMASSEIVGDYLETMDLLRSINPKIKTILTVSPVRHIRDGLVANNLSKSTLLQAVDQIVRRDGKSSYFPAYEIMIDVLRDYRFYKDDMIHPSEQAVGYIWNRFIEGHMDDKAKAFIEEWQRILKSLSHRPFHPSSPDHQKFLKSTINKLKSLEAVVDVNKELEQIKSQLN
ncbi:MAG: GSCFA domain-containing protein [Marinoscillum sp.]